MPMFVDFEKIFSKSQTATCVPPSMVEYLNESLPKDLGMKYEAQDDGTCVLVDDGQKVQFGGIEFSPTSEQLAVLGDRYSYQDILQYAYNAQESIQMVPQKEGVIIVNGQEVSVDMLYRHPYVPIKQKKCSIYMLPPKFPPPAIMKVSSAEYEQNMLVHRVPNKSLHIMKFESEGNRPLFITFLVDGKKNTMSLTISLNLKHVKTIRDIVESVDIFNAFMDGKGYLQNQPFTVKDAAAPAKRFDEDSAMFWKKVLWIEDYLGQSFVPPENDVDYNTMCEVERLYLSLKQKQPARERQKLNSVSSKWDMEKDKTVNDSKGKDIFFMFSTDLCFDIFGAKFNLPAIVGICKATLADYKEKDGRGTIYFGDADDKEPRYTSTICFKDEAGRQEFMAEYEGKHNELIVLLEQANFPENSLA